MIQLDKEGFDNAISSGTSVVDFWAEWCGPCKMLTPILEELDLEMDGVNFFKVDADTNPDLLAKFGISSIPSVGVFKDGELVGMQVGAKPKVLMKKFIDNSINL